MPAQLTWTESLAPASQIDRYEVWKSINVLPSVPTFLESFAKINTQAVERDVFGAITNAPYSYEDEDVDFSTNFYHYFIKACPVQGPSARSNTLPVATPPNDFTLSVLEVGTDFELTWTASGSPTTSIVAYQVRLSIDGAAFVVVATLPATQLAYIISGIDRSAHGYDVMVTAVDVIGLTTDSNIESFPQLLNVLFVCGQTVGGGSTNQAIIVSADNGVTWTAQTTPAGVPVRAMAQSMTRGGEILTLDTLGNILRSTDGGATWAALTNDIGNLGWDDLIRHEGFGLYVACGGAGLVKTSPDGVTWTVRTTPNANGYVRLFIANDGAILAGTSSNVTQPVMRSTDGGVTWALVAAFGFATDVQELAQATSGRYMFGARGQVSTVTTTDLSSFTQVGGLGAGQTSVAYNAALNLFIASSSAVGVFTSPVSSPAWTNRNASLPFQGIEDIISMQFAPGVIGIRPLGGSQTAHAVVRSLDGLSWTSTTPAQFAVAAVYRRIYEFIVAAP